MFDNLFHQSDATRVLQKRGVQKLLRAKSSTLKFPQLKGFNMTTACRLTPHQLNILDTAEVTNLLLGENCPRDFTWRSAVKLNDSTSYYWFGRSVDALISSKHSSITPSCR